MVAVGRARATPPGAFHSFRVDPDGVADIWHRTVTNIDAGALAGSALSGVAIPASLISIGDSAFAYCSRLRAFFFPSNAPVLGSGVCTSDNAVVYYLPWTTGWGATFGGLPAQPWVPQIQTGMSTFGFVTNQFGFDVDWADGTTIVIESCTNLALPIWVAVTTNTLSNGSFSFADPGWTNHPSKFYRVRSSE